MFYATHADGDTSARRGRAQPIVAVTGPQRGKLRGSDLHPYFATPHGDMMISGCFGLLRAFGEVYPARAARSKRRSPDAHRDRDDSSLRSE